MKAPGSPVGGRDLRTWGTLSDVLSLLGPVNEVAPSLLGAVLTASGIAVRITEVEAYAGVGQDPGSHAYRGRTPRTQVMFGRPGLAYLYFTYGMHWCANVVTGPEGEASAVLLRAGEVVGGLGLARAGRPGATDRDLCRGPARLCRTLGLDGSALGMDLLSPTSPVRLQRPSLPYDAGSVLTGPRVGVAGAGAATPWRFWLPGEPTVSTYRAAARRRPRLPPA